MDSDLFAAAGCAAQHAELRTARVIQSDRPLRFFQGLAKLEFTFIGKQCAGYDLQ